MKIKVGSFTLAALLGLACATSAPTRAADARAGALDIKAPWTRATVPGQVNGAGYLEVDNTGATADRLLAVRSDAAEKVEIHTMFMDKGTARMRPVEGGLEVPAGGKVTLAPGGYHLMFFKLKTPFAAGGSVPVVLTFEKAGEVPVTLLVRALSGQPGEVNHDTGAINHGGMERQ